MNEVKKQIMEVLNTITELSFEVTCKAVSNGFKAPVSLEVSGLDSEAFNPAIIEQVKNVAAIGVVAKMDPAVISKAVSLMNCPEECKAWVVCVLWFGFAPNDNSDHNAEWLEVYRAWDKLYSKDYNDKKRRDEVLLELGLPESWIKKRTASKAKISARKKTLRLT